MIYTLLNGCATGTPTEGYDAEDAGEMQAPTVFWWHARFKLDWPEQQEPDFFYHALIADRILRPVIANHGEDFDLWRFHRRSSRDNAGHQFSFIFYADVQTAENVYSIIEADETLSMLLRESDGKSDDKSNIAATSDKIWPPEIQQSWPYFIMGVSQSWLEQVRIVGKQIEGHDDITTETEFEEMSAYYRELDQVLSAQWTQYGRHAYFHHTNALYGYVPVYMREFGEQWRF